MVRSNEITIYQVKKMIREQFPQWADLPVRPVEFSGWDNRTFHLGDQFSVRLPSHQRYTAQVEKEHRWLPILAPHLPLPIPTPVAMGNPSGDYPFHWSVYRWLEGENTTFDKINDIQEYAVALATFLKSLYAIDVVDGPTAGVHNFHRGGSLTVYHEETMQAIEALGDRVNGSLAKDIWLAGLQSQWTGSPVWVHGDVSPSNLLLQEGRLSAVIDFGCMGVGDPACDLTIAWTLFDDVGRNVFRKMINLDENTWARSRSWAIWKALIVLQESLKTDPVKAAEANRVIQLVMKDHLQK